MQVFSLLLQGLVGGRVVEVALGIVDVIGDGLGGGLVVEGQGCQVDLLVGGHGMKAG